MKYELAEQLRDAGFPQSGNGKWIGPPEKIIWRSGDRTYVPTLEELIAACGTSFHDLRFWSTHNPPVWQATGDNPVEPIYEVTPVEAVAKLWLALSRTDVKETAPS
jgi:hypothetical protein